MSTPSYHLIRNSQEGILTRARGWGPTGFGRKLREFRVLRGLTQAQLALATGCHVQTVVKTEGGQAEPAWPLVLLFCAALGVRPDQFTVSPASAGEPKRPRGRPRKEN